MLINNRYAQSILCSLSQQVVFTICINKNTNPLTYNDKATKLIATGHLMSNTVKEHDEYSYYCYPLK